METGNGTKKLWETPLKRSVSGALLSHRDVFSNTGMSLQISEVVSLRPLTSSAVGSTSGSSSSSATQSCPMCRFTTTYGQLLTRHIRRYHDSWPFMCPHCDYQTHRSHDLKKHLRTHTGEKPYHCNLCSYQTSDPSNLSAHLKNRHSSARVEAHSLLPLWWSFHYSSDKGSNKMRDPCPVACNCKLWKTFFQENSSSRHNCFTVIVSSAIIVNSYIYRLLYFWRNWKHKDSASTLMWMESFFLQYLHLYFLVPFESLERKTFSFFLFSKFLSQTITHQDNISVCSKWN